MIAPTVTRTIRHVQGRLRRRAARDRRRRLRPRIQRRGGVIGGYLGRVLHLLERALGGHSGRGQEREGERRQPEHARAGDAHGSGGACGVLVCRAGRFGGGLVSARCV